MSTRIRLLLTGLAAILFGGAILLAYSGLAIEGPFLLQGDHRFGHVVTFGTLPFWLFLPMLAGLALLFAAWAVRDRSRLGTWGALLLLLLWGLQTTGQAVISFGNGLPVYREQPTFWVSEAFFAAKAWGLALLAGALVAVIAVEWLWPLARREQPQPTALVRHPRGSPAERAKGANMWVLGVVVGVVAGVVGAVISTLAFMDASGLEAMLPGIVLAALGSFMGCGFLVWGLGVRRRTSDEVR